MCVVSDPHYDNIDSVYSDIHYNHDSVCSNIHYNLDSV